MQTFRATRHAAAPAARVWAVATDLANAPDVITDIDAVEVLTPGPFGVGTRWRETRTMFGRSASEEMAVTAVDPGRSYTAEADSRRTHYVSTFTFVPVAGGTDVTMTFAGEPSGTLARALTRVTAPLTRRAVERTLRADLDDIAAAAEQDRPAGP
ncbi:SRPBCC family protein [Aquipuribacter sp. MA13-6]|uniref:SRPBCC family protein n=1 Tax=unclassified Aquipuribacter TaxID=2635084 RepID=UPI003EEB0573